MADNRLDLTSMNKRNECIMAMVKVGSPDFDQLDRQSQLVLISICIQQFDAMLAVLNDPDQTMVQAGARHALHTSISSDHPWPDYVARLFQEMLAPLASPAAIQASQEAKLDTPF